MARIDRHSLPANRTFGARVRIKVRNRELTIRAHFDRDLSGVVHVSHKSRRQGISGGFCVRCPMDYQAFTNDSLTMMYEGTRGALASDAALSGLGEEPRFRVRETPEWKKHAADLESEMLKRGMVFEIIDWSENQPKLPATGRPAPP
jgi:hypothetical protein